MRVQHADETSERWVSLSGYQHVMPAEADHIRRPRAIVDQRGLSQPGSALIA